MKRTKKFSLPFKMLASLMVSLLAALPAMAVDVQTFPNDTAAASGFTHGARITWDDLNATDNQLTTLQLFAIPTNTYIDRVAFYVDEPFTNSTVSATNLYLVIGVGGTTNFFFSSNCVDGAGIRILSGNSPQTLFTNMVVPYKATTSTNYLIATFAADASTVDTYVVGKIRILWRLVNPAKQGKF